MKNVFLSLRSKFIILCLLLLVIPALVIGTGACQVSKKQLDESGKEQLENSVKMVIGMINLLNAEVEAGHMTLEEAQESLRRELLGKKDSENQRTIKNEYTVKDSGYIWAIDEEAVTVMHPTNEGQDFPDIKTEDGAMAADELVKTSKKGGYVSYQWENPATDKVETKISYAEVDPHWGWVIGSGAYLSEFNSGASEILTLVFVISAISVISGIVIVSYFSKRLTKPIMLISEELNRSAQGDFSGTPVKVRTKDEVGRLANDFNYMKEHVKVLISQVHQSTEQLAASAEQLTASAEQTGKATEEITGSVQEVANGAEGSTNNLEESSHSLEEIACSLQSIAESSVLLSNTEAKATKQAKHGGELVEKTVQQISMIEQSVNESSEMLLLLDKRSNEIGGISKMITTIADQTNLLALNAAIEAARAGENGKGFAVVADEVRKLAEQSQQSSTQISQLIHEIQEEIVRSSNSMNRVKKEVQAGLVIVGRTKEDFKEIVDSLGEMDKQVNEMAATTEQISASTQEVSATVTNITAISKESLGHTRKVATAAEEQLASMEEILASASSLSMLAMELQKQVNRFKW
ncbi:methyl-accepting chemotaxis protein [Bacillus sp. B190/17]|uniref:Methyl-accepting chemotaxis protein n=1 Tax=Bacillus lumedeiriae TaxID=3058829 RepID=A0ABW8IA22_9BACI